MASILQCFSVSALKNLKFLQPQQICYQHSLKRYSEKVYENAKAKENVHFLKMQREQLKGLRVKITKEKELIKTKMGQLDLEIESIKQKNDARDKIPTNEKKTI